VVPWIVDYAKVLDQMGSHGMRSLYYNSGAFGFAPELGLESVGWIGPSDPTLRPAAHQLTRPVPPPYVEQLTERVVRAWRNLLPGVVWVMPKSHWAYELDFGSRDWMPAVLEHAGVDAGLLQPRTNAAAIEFRLAETEAFSHLVEGLLRMLFGSDFALAFPGKPVACTLHHHKQVWWTSTDRELIASLGKLADLKAD
jgi:hypothetical protein